MHVYVHVPFCGRRCSYCDFAIAVRSTTPTAAFVHAIRTEWAGRMVREASASTQTQTIYFGGGTPSRLDPAGIAALIEMIGCDWPLARGAEVTLEANPDDVTPDRAAAWVRAGVNRVSLGAQSHDARVLAWMHRTHCAEQVPVAVDVLRSAGIENISIDLIFALPDVLQRDWRRDLDLTLALGPAHLSLYGLTVEPYTPLFRWTERGEAAPVADDRYAAEFLIAHRVVTAAGFEHYEVSNYARPGARARHNGAYWSGADYVGLGPSAHSLTGDTRSWNVREWAEYADRISRGAMATAGEESLGPDARELERWYLGLRTSDGLDAALVPMEVTASWLAQGWATVVDGRLRLAPEGWLRLDALVGALAHS